MDTDTAYREYYNEVRRERYLSDPAYKARRLEYSRAARRRARERAVESA